MSSSEIFVSKFSSSPIGSGIIKSSSKEASILPFEEFLAKSNQSLEKDIPESPTYKECSEDESAVPTPTIHEEVSTISIDLEKIAQVTDKRKPRPLAILTALQTDATELKPAIELETPHDDVVVAPQKISPKSPNDILISEEIFLDIIHEAVRLSTEPKEQPSKNISDDSEVEIEHELDEQFIFSGNLQTPIEFEKSLPLETLEIISAATQEIKDSHAIKQPEPTFHKQSQIEISELTKDFEQVDSLPAPLAPRFEIRQKETVNVADNAPIMEESVGIKGPIITEPAKKQIDNVKPQKLLAQTSKPAQIKDKPASDNDNAVIKIATLEEFVGEFDISDIAIIDNSTPKPVLSFKNSNLPVFDKSGSNAFIKPQEQIALAVKYAVSLDKGEVRINLYPESLGAIDVRIEFATNNVGEREIEKVTITPERLSTLKLLEDTKFQLEASLTESKKTITTTITESSKKDGSLEFDMRGGNNNQHNGGYFDSFEERENWMNKFRNLVKTNEDLFIKTGEITDSVISSSRLHNSLHFINMEV